MSSDEKMSRWEAMEKKSPLVEGVLVNNGTQWKIICPHCGNTHHHGAGGGAGHRVQHCSQKRYSNRKGYTIIPASDWVREKHEGKFDE